MRRTQSKVRGKIPRKDTQREIDTEGTITIGKHEENDAPLHDPAHSDAKLARVSCVSHMQPAFLASFNLQVNRNLSQHGYGGARYTNYKYVDSVGHGGEC